MTPKFAGFTVAERGAITSLDQVPIKSRRAAPIGVRGKGVKFG